MALERALQQRADNIKRGLVQLTPREEIVIRAFCGIAANKLPPTELATRLHLSVSRTRRIRSMALTKLRNSYGIELDDLIWFAEQDSSLRGETEWVFTPPLQDIPVIVQATLDVQRLLDKSAIRPEELLQLTPRQFEELIAELWERLGYQVELTKRTRDGGRDVVAIRRAEAESRFLIECKRKDPLHGVGVGLVRALYGVKTHEKATKAFLATTSYFTRTAKEFFEQHRWELEPRDCQGVLDWIKTASQSKQTLGAVHWVPSLELITYPGAPDSKCPISSRPRPLASGGAHPPAGLVSGSTSRVVSSNPIAGEKRLHRQLTQAETQVRAITAEGERKL